MRRIVIPTDFSENAMNAICYAVALFKYERCEFFILHAYADEVYDANADSARAVFEEVKELTQKKVAQELARLNNQIKQISPNPRHDYNMLAVFGTLIDETNDIVNKENIDVVVMGTKGKTNDRMLTFGSNTLQVLKYVKCPVLAIPEECMFEKPKHILFPTDYFLPYKRRELKLLSTLAKSFRSTITMMHVSMYKKLSIRQEDNRMFLKESLSDMTLEFKTISSEGLTLAINEYIKNQSIDVLVLVNSRHSYLESVLYQSTIDKIGLHIKIPFLILQNLDR
ncbi:universal stress protein [Aquimarina pacifica]|uniref:universal stress protein n=1 Tax=Aquimarina pacifica TaxID=1296415 RepID=UPI00046EC0B1|nr:universal stress protein [Aquimarina pacifica]